MASPRRLSHLRVILNGKAGEQEALRRGIGRLRRRGHEVSVRVTWEAGDAERLAAEAVAESSDAGIDVLVAGGGDGTLNEVAAAVLKASENDPPFDLAVLPLGTANDFARSIRLDPSDLGACLFTAAEAEARPLDVGLVNAVPFVNVATGGFGARVTTETDPRLKKLFGGLSYLFSGLQRASELTGSTARISADGFEWQGNFIALALGNGRQAGGGVSLCPEALFDDGLLDLAVLPVPENGNVSEIVARLLEGGPEGLRAMMLTHRAEAYRIESREALQLNLDGEPLEGQSFEVGIRPGILRFRRP